MQPASWYAMLSDAVRHQFTDILDSEWCVVLGRSWNTKSLLVFSHIVRTKMLVIRNARGIWAQITRSMDLWDRSLHAGLVGDTELEGAAREGRASSRRDEEENTVSISYHGMVLLSKIRQAVYW